MIKIIDNPKLNNKGFTLIEMLTVVSIITILGLLVIPSTIGTINKSTKTTYNILVKDITIASKLLFKELDYAGNDLYHYTLETGQTTNKIKLELDKNNNKVVTINLQTLVSNGLLSGANNTNNQFNINNKVLVNPKTKEDIGSCQITITKITDKDNNYITNYELKNKSISNINCPTDKDYNDTLN